MALIDQLLGQRKACRGDNPHSLRCKRCRRGRAATNPVRPTNKREK